MAPTQLSRIPALICRPFAGRLAETLGRRPLLFFGALVTGTSMLLLPTVDSLALVVALRLVQGVAEAAFVVAGFAMLADIALPNGRGRRSVTTRWASTLALRWGRCWLRRWLAGAASRRPGTVAPNVAAFLPEPVRSAGGEGPDALIHRPAIPLSLAFSRLWRP